MAIDFILLATNNMLFQQTVEILQYADNLESFKRRGKLIGPNNELSLSPYKRLINGLTTFKKKQ